MRDIEARILPGKNGCEKINPSPFGSNFSQPRAVDDDGM
jgi:hypothetical protein